MRSGTKKRLELSGTIYDDAFKKIPRFLGLRHFYKMLYLILLELFVLEELLEIMRNERRY